VVITLEFGDRMSKLKKIWIIGQAFVVALSTFFTIYIPLMFLNFEFMKYLIIGDLYSGLFVFVVIGFGLIWISIFVMGKILYFFNDLYKWNEKYKNLNVR